MTLNLALPLAFNSQEEITAFQKAKERIEAKLQSRGVKGSVGTFGIAMPGFVLKPENINQAYENQAKAKLPLFTSEGPITFSHTLVGSLEKVKLGIEYFGEIAKLSGSTDVPHSIHHALFCPANYNGDFNPKSGALTLAQYQDNIDQLRDQSRINFDLLQKNGKDVGIDVCLETEPLFSWERSYDGNEDLIFKPSAEPELYQAISKRNMIFDLAHVATVRQAFADLHSQGIDTQKYMKALGHEGSVDSFIEEVEVKYQLLQPDAKAYHVSNTNGINTATTEPAIIKQWGEPSGSIDGILTTNDFQEVGRNAYERNTPVVIEVTYDAKNIAKNHFREADPMIDILLDGL